MKQKNAPQVNQTSANKSISETEPRTFSKGNQENLAFGKSNYTVMLIGVALILLGFVIMTLDKTEFGFGFLGLTLGPITAFVGFMVEFYAILKKKA